MNKLLIFFGLLIFPILSFAYDYPKSDGYHVDFNKDGSTRLAGGTTTERNISARTWQSTPEYEKTKAWFNRSISTGSASLENGAKINSKIPVALKNTVSKKTVMRGLLSNARIGGRFLAKSPWTYLAFTLVVDKLIDEANDQVFKWDANIGDFVTADDYVAIFLLNNLESKRIGISKANMNTGVSTYQGKVQSGCQGLSTKVSEYYNDTYNFKNMTVQGSRSFTCLYVQPKTNAAKYVYINVTENKVRPITQDEFDNIIIPIADASPSDYVNLSRPEQNSPLDGFSPAGHELTKGAAYSTDIYTDPIDGKAKTTTATVNQDGSSVTYSNTIRPDLDGDTEVAPIPTPNPKTDNNTEVPETPVSASTPLQCDSDKYPNSLGCVDTTEEIKDASMVIPQETVPLDFQVKNYITSSTGTCPQGSQFTLNFFSTHSYEFSFEPVCKFAEMIKYALWVCSWLLAYFIIIGRSE